MKQILLLISGFFILNASGLELQIKYEVTRSSEQRSIQFSELPLKVQKALQHLCKGKIVHITEEYMYNNTYYKIICDSNQGQYVYYLNSEGFPPTL